MTPAIDPRRRFLDSAIVFRDYLDGWLAILFAIVLVASPWILLPLGGWGLFFRWYLLPYPIVLISFVVLMTLVYRRELLARARNRRGNGRSEDLPKAA